MLTCCDPCGIDDLMYNLILEVGKLAYYDKSATAGLEAWSCPYARASRALQKQVARPCLMARVI